MEIHQPPMASMADRAGRERTGWTDATERWLDVFERHLGSTTRTDEPTDSVTPRSGAAVADEGQQDIGRLKVRRDDDGTRAIDRSKFRPPMPEPAEPGSSPSSAKARERQRAEVVSAFAEQIAAADSDEERAFEERQLELALARVDGEAPPATIEDNQRLIAKRMQFRS